MISAFWGFVLVNLTFFTENYDGKLQKPQYGVSPAGDTRAYPFPTQGLDLTPVGPPSDLHIEMVGGRQHGGDGSHENLASNIFPNMETENRLHHSTISAHQLPKASDSYPRAMAYNAGQLQATTYVTGPENHYSAPHFPAPEYSNRHHYQYSQSYCQPMKDFPLVEPPVNFDRSFSEAGYRTSDSYLDSLSMGAPIQPPSVLSAAASSLSPGPLSPVKSPR